MKFRKFFQLLESNGDVEETLRKMVVSDQAERNVLADYYTRIKPWQKALAQYKKDKGIVGDEVFPSQSAKLRSILHSIDWKKLSENGWNDVWLLAQHADDDIPLQRLILTRMKDSPNPDHGKYLQDRISMAEHGTQVHGTQNNPYH